MTVAQTHRQIAERERGRQVVCAQQAMEQGKISPSLNLHLIEK